MNSSATGPKRPRAPSGSSSSSLTTSPGSSNPPHKASRIIAGTSFDASTSSNGSGSTVKQANSITGRPLLCNLPPTCHQHPTPIANTNDLERHYATYHAHVCEVDRCGCVFTDARLLELHQTECHDPIAALRKERGEKIFQCHLPAPACGRSFLTPKARRLHLIQAHGYPKEYFFAVTNKGIGGLLKKWGEGASMIRKEWKPREQEEKQKVDTKNYREDGHDGMDEDEDEDSEDEDEEDEDEDDEMHEEDSELAEAEEPADLEATPRMLPRTTGIHSPQSSISSSQSNQHHRQSGRADNTNDVTGVAGLTNSLNSLSLVPKSIRFGRGGKSGGFFPNPRGFRGRGRGRSRGGIIQVNSQQMDADPARPGMDGDLGARGRGRGRIVPPRARSRGRGRGY